MKLKHFTNIWFFVFAGLIALVLLLIVLFTGWVLPPEDPGFGVGGLLVTVYPAPSITPTINENDYLQEIDEPLGDSGTISAFIGSVVQIYNTDGAGLRLRAEPGISGKVQFLGEELELFEVKDGPVEEDGYIWWYLESPYDTSRSGWAAADFLKEIDETE